MQKMYCAVVKPEVYTPILQSSQLKPKPTVGVGVPGPSFSPAGMQSVNDYRAGARLVIIGTPRHNDTSVCYLSSRGVCHKVKNACCIGTSAGDTACKRSVDTLQLEQCGPFVDS